VSVAVLVGVSVAVLVGVNVGVAVSVAVGVEVDVDVAVDVGVDVGVQAGLTSVGQLSPLPVHVSAMSQAPALTRQTWPPDRNWQLEVQHDVLVPFAAPRSHCSPLSRAPLPQATVSMARSSIQ
jgi:hypothetical protein